MQIVLEQLRNHLMPRQLKEFGVRIFRAAIKTPMIGRAWKKVMHPQCFPI